MGDIQKPLTLAKEDLTRNVVASINSSGLPLLLVEYVLKDILNDVHRANMNQLREDSRNYSAQLDAQKDDESQN